jgi:alkylated DNA repair dioxygenase AlkB
MNGLNTLADLGICTDYKSYDLPGGTLHYYENFLNRDFADFYFDTFMQMPFKQGGVARGMERRKSCFYSELRNKDGTLRDYRYAGKTNPALEFQDELSMLKVSVEMALGKQFNSCLANLYETGKDVIGWHADTETSLVAGYPIASISLGAERIFDVRAQSNAPNPELEYSIRLKHGSMIVMGGDMQNYYKHQLRREAKVFTPRINLTIRRAK